MSARRTYPLPEGACIWMEAGVIDYRLCNRSFDCENCALDQALRGGLEEHIAEEQESPSSLPATRFHRSHLWVRETLTCGEWMIGLDHHALSSFSRPMSLSLPRPGRAIAQGDELLALLVDGEALRWSAPVAVFVLERNDRWVDDAATLQAAPYTDGWAALVKFPECPADQIWMARQSMDALERSEHEALKQLVMAGMNANRTAGVTAPDGGHLIAPPDQLLPLRDYLAFLRVRWDLLPAGC